jgi:hypothetical protein
MDSERVLSPLVSRHSMAGGGVETEALGGVGRSRRVRPNGPWSHWAFRPFAYRDRTSDGDATTHFLVPLGIEKERPNEYLWQVLPVARWERHTTDSGREVKTFFALPGVYWSQREDGRIVRAWFPFTGVMENFLSYDRIEFTLFPLWLRTRRGVPDSALARSNARTPASSATGCVSNVTGSLSSWGIASASSAWCPK